VLDHLGTTCELGGDTGRVRAAWQQAMSIMTDLHPAQAQDLEERMAGLDLDRTNA
jgi:hypothetical protein